jgi:hypothetical protein
MTGKRLSFCDLSSALFLLLLDRCEGGNGQPNNKQA